jgi:hypothetical protein
VIHDLGEELVAPVLGVQVAPRGLEEAHHPGFVHGLDRSEPVVGRRLEPEPGVGEQRLADPLGAGRSLERRDQLAQVHLVPRRMLAMRRRVHDRDHSGEPTTPAFLRQRRSGVEEGGAVTAAVHEEVGAGDVAGHR